MPVSDLVREWGGSVAILSDLLGEPITSASVPSGYYSRRVAEAAATAGIRLLFTLEPSTSTTTVQGCLVAGRYTIRDRHSAEYAASIASGARVPRLRQHVSWNVKKVLKAMPGYSGLREFYLETVRS